MTQKLNKIVFFGSGPVAAKSLALLSEIFDIEAIITKPSTTKLMSGVVFKTTIHAVSNKLELDELLQKNKFSSDVGILIDFGIIVSQEVIDKFALGIVNSHFSLLPEWRGADPITFSILSGQKKTGVSLMLLSAGMDEGLILAQAECEISEDANSISLTADLIELSDSLLYNCLPLYIDGSLLPLDQTSSANMMGLSPTPTYSRKLTKEDGRIDWTKDARFIEREIRAYYEWPKSYTTLNNIDVTIKNAQIIKMDGEPGKYEYDKKSLVIFCGKDALSIKTLQPAGKKEMPISSFLAGYKL
jgi:methionyl-tRNA formyltransferase